MAHYRFHVKPGPKGAGAEHAQYIERSGRFKAEKYGEIGEHEVGNLPAWAKGSAARFFAAADEYERANGNSYREFELALPRELSHADRGKLVREFVAEQIGDRHAYSWAIHEPDGHNPHVHIMFSERKLDGIERGPEQYFKRANTKNPERGGHLKTDWFTGRGGPEAIEVLRARWAEVQNIEFERLGLDVRVDHRSLKAQGIEREPGRHRGPAVSGLEARGEVADVSVRREAERVARAKERAAVQAEVRVVTREELAIERVAMRERRELAREVTGADRELVLPLLEADRREQIGRAQAAAERRVERRQGLGIGGELKEKLLTQARALRARIGQQLGRVKEWIAERFPEPLKQIKERSRDFIDTAAEKAQRVMRRRPGASAEKAPERDAEPAAPEGGAKPQTSEEIRAAAREQWLQSRALQKESGAATDLEGIRRQGREDWLKLRAELAREASSPAPTRSIESAAEDSQGLEREAAPSRPAEASPSGDPTLEQIIAQGRAANAQVAQALERERLQAQEREEQLAKERSRGRGRGRGLRRSLGDDDDFGLKR